MEVDILGRNIAVTDGLRTAVIENTKKLNKFFGDNVQLRAVLRTTKGTSMVELTAFIDGVAIRAEEKNEDMYDAIHDAVETMERRARKYKEKSIEAKRRPPRQTAAEEKKNDDLVRVKRIKTKPLYPEEAVIAMEAAGHDFYMFLNADTGTTCVVYKRYDGGYGLIEPEN